MKINHALYGFGLLRKSKAAPEGGLGESGLIPFDPDGLAAALPRARIIEVGLPLLVSAVARVNDSGLYPRFLGNPEVEQEFLTKIFESAPFETVYFGLSSPLDFVDVSEAFDDSKLDGKLSLFGYLVDCRSRLVVRVATTRDRDQNRFMLFFGADKFALALLLVSQVMNDKLPPEEVTGLKLKLDREKASKKAGVKIPPVPYYRIHSDVERRIKTATIPREVDWSHRWDVRCHKRLVTKRGEMPLTQRTGDKYQALGYDLDPGARAFRVQQLLESRGLRPRRVNEWVAAKLVDVKPCVKGPRDKPYVPGLRDVIAIPGAFTRAIEDAHGDTNPA